MRHPSFPAKSCPRSRPASDAAGPSLSLGAELGGLGGSQRLEVVQHGGLNSGARDQDALHTIQELTPYGDFKSCALAAARGVEVASVRYLLLGCGGVREREGQLNAETQRTQR